MLVVREFRFEAAHHLPRHPGKCRRPHGHGYVLRVACRSPVDPESGMAMDFADLKAVVEEHVLEAVDHRDLNEILPNPSAEHLAVWAWGRLAAAGLPLAEIQVRETATCWVVYRGEGLGAGRDASPAGGRP